MLKYLYNSRKFSQKNKIVFFSFLIFFILGSLIYKDYGISIDEQFHRSVGYYWLDFILKYFPESRFSIEASHTLKNIAAFNLPDLNVSATIRGQETNISIMYGVIFDLPLAFIDIFFNIDDSKLQYELRHFFNFIIFFSSTIFFYKILNLRFNNWKISLLGTFFLILSPRIFANSFYNNKDIVFLSLLIISIYFAFKFLKNVNLNNALTFSFFAALATSSRILGLMIVLIFLVFFAFDFFSNPKKNYESLKFIFLTLLCYFIFTIILWPYLWSSPINNFINAFAVYSDYPLMEQNMLYLGDYIKSNNIPWHYPILWIIITTPFIYIILFFIGFFKILGTTSVRFINIENNDNLWNDDNEKFDLFIFLFLTLSLFLIIKLDSVLYTGWRQLYFLHPLIIYISVLALNYIFTFISKRKNELFLYSVVLFYLFYIGIKMYQMHPFQNIYFNFLTGNNVHEKFEVDYWGLANKSFLEKMLEIEKNKNDIYIGAASFTTLARSFNLVDKEKRDRIKIVGLDFDRANYIFTNFMSEVNKNTDKKYDIPKNFVLFDTFYVNGVKVYEVYKKNN